ncbi:ammonium transporter Rh type B-like isoform X2 [Panulirus ornatus]|uniref:ammonium transporter Rh type B-like isoform X2 n=1 Tax=Panulirus ornatus TaxID=150431 RepID=UPI003A863863
MVRCWKVSSPSPPERARSETTHPPGVHLRGLSVTIADTHRPALGFSILQDLPQGHPDIQREAGPPRTPSAHKKRSSGHSNLNRASPRLGFPGRKDGEESLRKEEKPQMEALKQDGHPPQDVAAPRPEQHRQREVGKPMWYLTRTTATLLVLQGLFIILFTAFIRYDEMADASHQGNNHEPILGGNIPEDNPAAFLNPQLTNMQMLVLVGVGLRLTFLREFSYSSVGLSLLVMAISLQWAILCVGFMSDTEVIYLSIHSLLVAGEVSISGSVSQGAVAGAASPLQLVLLTLFHVPLQTITARLSYLTFQAVDRGGSVSVHLFGAMYGVSARFALGSSGAAQRSRASATKTSQVTAFVGTMMLVVYLPSVWTWTTIGDDLHRALLNTFLTTVSAAVIAFPVSSIAHTRRKFSLRVLRCRVGVEDTAGVGVTHGLAGLMGGLLAVIMATMASETGSYGHSVYQIYPAMAPRAETQDLSEVTSYLVVAAGLGRRPILQAAYQLAAVLATATIALLGGLLSGLLLRLPLCERLTQDDLYNDGRFWQLPTLHPPPCHANTHAHGGAAPTRDQQHLPLTQEKAISA